MTGHKQSFQKHRSSAKHRGIPFELTYEQWLSIWGDKIDQKGRGANQFGMCRIRDKGGYSIGNVYIGTPTHNQHDRSVALKVRRAQVSMRSSAASNSAYECAGWMDRSSVFDAYEEDAEDEVNA